ncbi:MAG: protein-export chaperone SecB [Neisseria sp.]|nr:protein-export chaperone SecB [Neisseria sp.]
MSEQQQAVFSIEKLYVKDLSLEVPHGAKIFLAEDAPEVDMRVATEHEQLEEGYFHVALTVTVTATLPDKRVMFLNEVTQCGIFQMANIPEEDQKLLLAVACPNILYPYARETISNTVTRAGFPPVLIAPINFEAMYAQQMAEQEGETAQA